MASRVAHSKRPRTPFEALSKDAQLRLRELIESLDPLGQLATRARSGSTDVAPMVISRPTRRDLRLPKPGDVLSRNYKGRAVTVRVLEKGFEFEGRQFRSLSAIAKTVTGAHWNGLLFFGLVRQER